jgi:hypothetical protein
MGWLLLSGLPRVELTRLFSGQTFLPMTDQTPTSMKRLLEIVEEAGRDGHVISRRHEIVAAIDISGPDSAFDLVQIAGRYLAAVRVAASGFLSRVGEAFGHEMKRFSLTNSFHSLASFTLQAVAQEDVQCLQNNEQRAPYLSVRPSLNAAFAQAGPAMNVQEARALGGLVPIQGQSIELH